MNKLSKEMKIITIGAALCLLGAVALDCGIPATGIALIVLGAFAILVGPLAVIL